MGFGFRSRPSDNSDDPVAAAIREQNRRLMIGGMWAAILIVGVMVFLAMSPPAVALPVVLVSITLFGVFGLVYFLAREKEKASADRATDAVEMPAAETLKRKRATGTDMYTLIDRMLTELDEDELIYLRRRLAVLEDDDETASTDLATSLEDLLNERQQRR